MTKQQQILLGMLVHHTIAFTKKEKENVVLATLKWVEHDKDSPEYDKTAMLEVIQAFNKMIENGYNESAL